MKIDSKNKICFLVFKTEIREHPEVVLVLFYSFLFSKQEKHGEHAIFINCNHVIIGSSKALQQSFIFLFLTHRSLSSSSSSQKHTPFSLTTAAEHHAPELQHAGSHHRLVTVIHYLPSFFLVSLPSSSPHSNCYK